MRRDRMSRFETRLARSLTAGVLETAISDGKLDPRGKTNEEFKKESLRYLRELIDSKAPIVWSIDFRSTLLSRARALRKKKKEEEAILYYVTWIEHMLNSMIAAIFRRRKMDDEWIRTFVKETGLRAKYAFVIISLVEKAPSKRYADRIRELADRRNQFVHYKWSYQDDAKSEIQTKAFHRALPIAEKLVRHLHQLEHRHVLYGVERTSS